MANTNQIEANTNQTEVKTNKIATGLVSLSLPEIYTPQENGEFHCSFSIDEDGAVKKGDEALITVSQHRYDTVLEARSAYNKYTRDKYFNLRKKIEGVDGSALMLRSGLKDQQGTFYVYLVGNVLVIIFVVISAPSVARSGRNSIPHYHKMVAQCLATLSITSDAQIERPDTNTSAVIERKVFARPKNNVKASKPRPKKRDA